MRKKKFIPLIDFPIVPAGQNPLYIIWLNSLGLRIGLIVIALMLPLVLSFYAGRVELFTLIDRSIIYLSVAQLILLLKFGCELSLFSSRYILFLCAFYIGVYLITLGFPEWKPALGMENRGFDNNNRFSAFSAEPSYFAEIVIMFTLLFLASKKFSLGFFFFVLFFVLSQAKTLVSFALIFLFILLFTLILTGGKKIFITGVQLINVILLVLLSALAFFYSELGEILAVFQHEYLNSWRMISGVVAIREAEFHPNPLYRDLVHARSLDLVSWSKPAVWAFIPFVTIYCGLGFFSIGFVLGYIFLIRKFSGKTFSFGTVIFALLLTGVLHCLFFAPKWLLVGLIGVAFIVSSRQVERSYELRK